MNWSRRSSDRPITAIGKRLLERPQCWRFRTVCFPLQESALWSSLIFSAPVTIPLELGSGSISLDRITVRGARWMWNRVRHDVWGTATHGIGLSYMREMWLTLCDDKRRNPAPLLPFRQRASRWRVVLPVSGYRCEKSHTGHGRCSRTECGRWNNIFIMQSFVPYLCHLPPRRRTCAGRTFGRFCVNRLTVYAPAFAS